MESVLRFDAKSENLSFVKQLLKSQGIETCLGKISTEWLTSSVLSVSFGFVYMTPKAQLGRRSVKSPSDRYHVHGFVTCRAIKENPKIIWIDLVCSRLRSKIGKLLMELAEEACKEIQEVQLINLYSLPETRLRNWYKGLGYTENAVPNYEGGKVKSYLMTKFIR